MTLPILEIPEKISNLCQPYKPIFSKPQFKQFERFLTGLIVNDKADIQSLAEGFNISQSYDALHHFVSEAPWDINNVIEQTTSMLKSLPKDRRLHSKGILIIDDTLIEKFGKFMQAAGKLYDHSQNRYLDYAHCLVSLVWVDARKLRYPLRFEIYRKKQDCEKHNLTFKTKVEIAKQLIDWAIEQGIPFQTVVFDAWFFSRELVDHIESLHKDWVSRAKSNRNIVVGKEPLSLKHYWEQKVNLSDFRETKVKGKTYSILSDQQRLPSLKRGKEKIRVVICLEKKDKSKSEQQSADKGSETEDELSEPVFLVSNRKDFRPETIIRSYQLRWNIETFFKDAKSHLGLGRYQMRKLNGIKSHWCLVFTSAVALELVRWDVCTEKGLKVSEMSFGELKQRAFGNALKAIITQVVAYTKAGFSTQEIFSMLQIA